MKRIFKVTTIMTIVCILIRLFIGELCYIPSESMKPTLCTGDWVWINKVSYGALLPNRFADIPLLNIFTWVPFLRTMDEKNNWKNRRLVGLHKPALRDIVVFRSPQNRNVLLVKRIINKIECNGISYYYVLGDNIDNSLDSRSFGEISEITIIGKVNWTLFSVKDQYRILKRIE